VTRLERLIVDGFLFGIITLAVIYMPEIIYILGNL
jgi:hypothetical protein|tara:strand:- start:295 stop:399 length:105 start_codon:yes stop_codon:yes gene_type:complete